MLAVPVLLDSELPAALRRVLGSVREECRALENRVAEVDCELGTWLPPTRSAKQLQAIPGIG